MFLGIGFLRKSSDFIRQLVKSLGFIVLVFFFVPVHVGGRDAYKTCAGTKKNKQKQSAMLRKPAQAPKKQEKTNILATSQESWVHSS